MPALYRALALLDIMPNTDYYRWRVPVRCQAISPALCRQKALFNRHYKGTVTGIVNTSKYLVRDTVRYRYKVLKNYTTLYVQVSFGKVAGVYFCACPQTVNVFWSTWDLLSWGTEVARAAVEIVLLGHFCIGITAS